MVQYYIISTKYSIRERKTKKNGIVYDVYFRVITLDGEEKQKKLSGYKTKTLAKHGHAEFITKSCELIKHNPGIRKDITKTTPTVGELVEQYLASLYNQNKDSSIYDKKKNYSIYILPYYENTKIDKLSREELYHWQDNLWSKKNPKTNDYYSYNYLSKIRGQFSSFLSWCESRYGYKNNFQDIKKPKRRIPKTEMKIFVKDEFEKFISVVDDPMYHCLFTLLFYTGRRKGELFALEKRDIQASSIKFDKSLTRRTIDNSPYKITSTKADKSQTIPMCPRVQNELKNYSGDEPFFFGGNTPLSATTVKRHFDNYCKKAEVKQIRIHDLRHSFVSMMIHEGVNLAVIADLIGDTLEQVTKTYGHMYVSDMYDAVSKLT